MKVLFIEDDKNLAEMVRMSFEEYGHECDIIDFTKIEPALTKIQPDIIILDLMDSGAFADTTGQGGSNSYRIIWNMHFCPIIIYSANPGLFQEEAHPFVRKVQKGNLSEELLLKEVENFSSYIEGMAAIKSDVAKAIHHTLRDLVPIVSDQITDQKSLKKVLQHMGRRRLAAQIDNMAAILEEQLYPWEQYIYPPIDESPKLGDIIIKKDCDKLKPESYRLILTPSCDLVCKGDQKAKVTEVLCAKCFEVDVLFKKPVDISQKTGKLTSKVLTPGYFNEYVPLPGFDIVIPPMVANLKKNELIKYETIKNDNSGEYIRVVSIDSPFREQIAWAYLNTAGRPGVPDRNFEIWEKQYLDVLKGNKQFRHYP